MGDGLTEALGGTRIICKDDSFTLIVRVGDGGDAEELASRIAGKLGCRCRVVG